MASSKCIGYVGGAAVAVGVGAAIAAAGQGTANADTGKSDSSGASHSSTSSSGSSAKAHAGPKRSTAKATTRPKPLSKLGDKAEHAATTVNQVASGIKSQVDDAAAEITTAVSRIPAPRLPSVKKPTSAEFEATEVKKLQGLYTGKSAAAVAAATETESETSTSPAAATTTLEDPSTTSSGTPSSIASSAADATVSVPWSPNPFRPLPPEPAPNDMPGPLWDVEKAVMGVFPDWFSPVPREAFEAGYRVSQMIPWVNVVVPLSNVLADLPDALNGDKDASQRVVNNLIVTIQPVAVAYYGYNEIADLLNLEQEALDLQEWAITTAWDILDPFQLLHNRGTSGLPLSTTTPPPYPPDAASSTVTTLAAAVTPTTTDSASTTADSTSATSDTAQPTIDPFRADDPWVKGMPDAVLGAEKAILAAIPAPLQPLAPVVREAYEAAYRASLVVPVFNAVVPVVQLLPALIQATLGDKDTAQATINQLLLTTTGLSLPYYAWDEVADLLNVEEEADAAKQEIFASVWDELDPNGVLHVPGHSGLPA